MRKLLLSIIDKLFPAQTEERPSPRVRITPEQADKFIRLIQTVPGYETCFVAAIAPTNSMEPSIDDGMYVVLEARPYSDLIIGDIIWFETPTYKAIHRIIEIAEDAEGWYCQTRGDNNGRDDGVKVRPEHIKGVWRMTLD